MELREVLRIAKKAQRLGRDALEPWERGVLDEFEEMLKPLALEAAHPESVEGYRLWEALPQGQRELYADWTPRQLYAILPLLDGIGMKRPDDD